MNLRKTALLAFAAVLATALTGCDTARRAGKDASVVLLSPGIVLYGGFTDGYAASQEVRDGLGGSAMTQVVAMPFTTTYHLIKHAIWGVIHAVDFIAFPIYGLADLNPNGPKIEPLDYYTGTIFDNPNDNRSGTDPQSGENQSGASK